MVLISYIIPVYNLRLEDVQKCVESILHQTINDYEVILVDDGSSNGIESYCDHLGDKYSFKVIHQENQGLAVARNAGMKLAKGKWIVHVDGDDYIDIRLTEFLKKEDKTTSADVLVWGYVLDDGVYKKELLLQNKNSFDKPYQEIKENIICSILGCDTTFRSLALNTSWAKAYRSVFIKNNKLYYNPCLRRAQDAVYNLYVFEKTKSVGYIDKTLNIYNTSNNSLSRGYNAKTYEYLSLTAKAVKSYAECINSLLIKNASNIFIQRLFRMICEQQFMHKDNPLSFRERKMMFCEAINKEPFRSAFKVQYGRSGLLFKIEDRLYKNQWFGSIEIFQHLLQNTIKIKNILNKKLK